MRQHIFLLSGIALGVENGEVSYMTNNIYEAKWTGSYPNLCSGFWHLYENGKEIDLHEVGCPFVAGPDDYYDCHAGTYGRYTSWHFENWFEAFEEYNDGLEECDWIEENKDWLINISENEDDWHLIYDAFNVKDFRPGECGGCI